MNKNSLNENSDYINSDIQMSNNTNNEKFNKL
jgi:hypothetical protein